MKKIICLGLLLTMVLSSVGASCFADPKGKKILKKRPKTQNVSSNILKSSNDFSELSESVDGFSNISESVDGFSNISKSVNDFNKSPKSANDFNKSPKSLKNSDEIDKSLKKITANGNKVARELLENRKKSEQKEKEQLEEKKKKINKIGQDARDIFAANLKYVKCQNKNNDLDQLKENRKQVLEELKCDRDQCHEVNKFDDQKGILMKNQKRLEEKQKEFTNLKCKKEIMDKKLAIQNLENCKKYLKDLEKFEKEVENKIKEITDKIKEIEDAKKKNANDQKECKQNIIKALYGGDKKKLELVYECDLLNKLKRNRERFRDALLNLDQR